MAIRSATLYQGEDLAPTIDYTDYVIWEESEFGTRAWQGEGNASTIVIRDPLGEQGSALSLPAGLTMRSLASKNLFVIKVGSDFLFRGRIGIKNYSRDGQQIERYRQVEAQLHDTNWDLDHIFVHDYPRSAETDKARVQGLIASYLSASPRPTTALNGSNFISSSNLVTLPAHTYNRTSPLQILREIATSANKQFFVTGDTIGGGSLFWDGNDSTAYASTLSISDRATEVNYSSVFPPIWNVGPASTEDGSQQLCEVKLFWGTGQDQFVTAHNLTVHTQYGHSSETFTDDTISSEAEAQGRANAILAHRQYEDRTYNVTIGPLTDAQVVLIEHGQTIPIKARAIPDADDAYRTMRIVQCRYTVPVEGTWFAHLQLGRPWKMQPYGTGPVLVPGVHRGNEACIETFSRTTTSGIGLSEIHKVNWDSDPELPNAHFVVNGSELEIFRPTTTADQWQNVAANLGLNIEYLFKFRWEGTGPTSINGYYGQARFILNNTGSNPLTHALVALRFEYLDGSLTGSGVDECRIATQAINASGLSGTVTTVPSTDPLTNHKARFRIENGFLRAKMWVASQPEPAAWEINHDLTVQGTMPNAYTFQGLYVDYGDVGIRGFIADNSVKLILTEYELVEPCAGSVGIIGGPGVQAGEGPEAAAFDHDHDAVYNGAPAGGDLAGTYPNPTVPHITDTSAAHAAASIGFTPNGSIAATNVQTAIQEVRDEAAGGGGVTVEDEGTPLATTATTLDFVGAGVTATGAGAEKTITIPGAAATNYRTSSALFDEFFFTATTDVYEGGIKAVFTGTGLTNASAAGGLNHPGVVVLTTGTDTTGAATLIGPVNQMLFSDGVVRLSIVGFLNTLSSVSQTYTARLGFGDTAGGESSNGLYFRYTNGVNSGKWERVSRDGGAETAADTGTTADTNWHLFEISVSADGTSAEFFIDGVSKGTNSTNVPTGNVGIMPLSIVKSAGSTARTARVDAYWCAMTFDTTR